MKKLRDFRETCSLCEFGLLHLYGQISSSSGHFSTQKRNSILHKWLKIQLKKPQYSGIKKLIKNLLLITKQPVSVESKLWDLNALNQSYRDKLTDEDCLFIYFSDLYNIHSLSSRVYDCMNDIEDNVIYVSRDDLDDAFDDMKGQHKPLRVSVTQATLTDFLSASVSCGGYSLRTIGQREDVDTLIDVEVCKE